MNYGVSDARRVPCARKPDTHGFHPSTERCAYCEPLSASTPDETTRGAGCCGLNYYGYACMCEYP